MVWNFNERFASKLPELMTGTVVTDGIPIIKLSLPWQMVFYLSVAAIVMIVVSRFTKPQDDKILDQLYETLRTPVLPGEPEVPPLTLPEMTKPAPRNPLIDIPGFEIMKPSTTTVVGFLASCGFVVFLIALFAWIIS